VLLRAELREQRVAVFDGKFWTLITSIPGSQLLGKAQRCPSMADGRLVYIFLAWLSCHVKLSRTRDCGRDLGRSEPSIDDSFKSYGSWILDIPWAEKLSLLAAETVLRARRQMLKCQGIREAPEDAMTAEVPGRPQRMWT
jgi:hypothetical protein